MSRSHYMSFDNIIVSPNDVDNYPYFGTEFSGTDTKIRESIHIFIKQL